MRKYAAAMPYALLTAIPFIGHLNPLLHQAQELRRRGWQAAIAAHGELAAHVASEAADVEFLDLGRLGPLSDRLRAIEEDVSTSPSYTAGALRWLPALVDMWPSHFDGLARAVANRRPDVMVVDVFTSAGMSAAEAAGIPFVINNPALLPAVPPELLPPAPGVPFVTSGRSIHEIRWWDRASEPLARHLITWIMATTLGRRINRLRISRGLAPIGAADLMRTRLVLVDGVFGLEYERALPSNVVMVGPMHDAEAPALSPEMAAWLADGPPVIYANLGTVANASATLLTKMLEAFTGLDARVLWVVRDRFRDRLPAALPPNIRLVNWIDSPRALLAHPNVRVFVSHCGINSVYESMTAGTPVVGIPMLSDQRDMAVRVADAGVGLWVDKSRFTAAQLRSAIDRVRRDDAFRSRIAPIQQACARAGGVRRAVDLIEQVAQQPVRAPA